MKTRQEILLKAKEYAESIGSKDGTVIYDYAMGYTQCQEDTKQILLDFIKWSNAVDEYGNKLDKIDVDNFLNKQD